MKPNRSNAGPMGRAFRELAVVLVAFFAVSACAQDAQPEQGPADAKAVERKAEKVGKVERDGREVQDPGDRPDKGPMDKAHAKDRRWIEAKRELRKAQEALKDLREGGKEAEADEVERRVRKLESKLERLERAPDGDRGAEPEWGGPRPPREGPEWPPEQPELERRLRHLKVAVDNLHAAGMHDVADKLAREGERMRRELGEDGRAGLRGPMPPGPEMEQLRAELEELRGTVKQLQERVEALSR